MVRAIVRMQIGHNIRTEHVNQLELALSDPVCIFGNCCFRDALRNDNVAIRMRIAYSIFMVRSFAWLFRSSLFRFSFWNNLYCFCMNTCLLFI
ncbi:unnamed protein product [Anisakis simplex]|uniref:DNA-directed RNA polymerase n=1 Tax=Anisakis simplex TaxID=6269 RepID=A0A0M3J8L1_ANISI|nr:unnamed protein product [Anisakis simplex]